MVTPSLDTQGGVITLDMPSGRIASFVLPNDASLARNTGLFGIGETSATPQGSYIEVSVSKCRGVIDTSVPRGCYFGSYTQNWNEVSWFFQTGPYTAAAFTARGFCSALKVDATGAPQTWYVNVRWTYPGVPYWGNFGRYMFQWGNGSY
jgi:hypothetical protein